MLADASGTARAVDAGTAWRTDLDGFADRDAEAGPALAVYRLAPQPLPLAIAVFGRHPGSPQVLAYVNVLPTYASLNM